MDKMSDLHHRELAMFFALCWRLDPVIVLFCLAELEASAGRLSTKGSTTPGAALLFRKEAKSSNTSEILTLRDHSIHKKSQSNVIFLFSLWKSNGMLYLGSYSQMRQTHHTLSLPCFYSTRFDILSEASFPPSCAHVCASSLNLTTPQAAKKPWTPSSPIWRHTSRSTRTCSGTMKVSSKRNQQSWWWIDGRHGKLLLCQKWNIW